MKHLAVEGFSFFNPPDRGVTPIAGDLSSAKSTANFALLRRPDPNGFRPPAEALAALLAATSQTPPGPKNSVTSQTRAHRETPRLTRLRTDGQAVRQRKEKVPLIFRLRGPNA